MQKDQQCLNKISNTPDGEFYNFFSPLSMLPGWGPNPPKSRVDNAVEVGGKLSAYGFFRSVSNGSFFARTPFGSMSGAAADSLEAFADIVAAPAIVAATGGYLTVHVGCAIAAIQ